jgi:hypothetical protein
LRWTVFIDAGQDTTLIEEPDGALANGAGPVFFVGRTNQRQNSVRRGLIYFDVAAVLPRRARVESVRLTLYMSPSNSAPRQIALHRVLAGWGEGTSFASGGSGDFSTLDDATWIHTFYDDGFWVKPGGHFVARASASREVAASAFYTWEGTRKMMADVRLWLAAPHRNFGWILLGDETTPQNVKAFASREEPDPSLRPVLEVIYHLPGRKRHPAPGSAPSVDRSPGNRASLRGGAPGLR